MRPKSSVATLSLVMPFPMLVKKGGSTGLLQGKTSQLGPKQTTKKKHQVIL